MSPGALALLLGAVLAGEPVLLASAGGPRAPESSWFAQSLPGQVEPLVPQALPPPPQKVVRQTRSYGTVTIDHRAHLERRAPCKSCHDPGPITKLTFTPRVAHDRCRSCHREQNRGPLDCKGCHVVAPEGSSSPALQVAAVSTPSAAAERGAAKPAAAAFSAAASPAMLPPDAGFSSSATLDRTDRAVQLGMVAGSTGTGLGVQLRSVQNGILISHALARMSQGTEARTLGLFGVGVARSVGARFTVEASGLAGFSAVEKPTTSVLASAGARLGVGWIPGHSRFSGVHVAITGIVAPSGGSAGQRVSGSTAFCTVGTGLSLSRTSR